MAVISELAVAISARTEKLQAGLRRAANEVKIFGVGIESIASSLAVGLAGGAAAAGLALTNMAARQMEAIDAAVELGERIGATQRDIAGFELAAKIVGGSVEQIAGALAKMNRTIGDAVGGSKDARKAIESLGLSVSGLIAMKPVEAFGAIADAIKAIETPAGQASAAVAIFGRSGAEILNVLQLGGEGLADFRKKADDTGLALSKSAAEDVSKAADGYDMLKANVRGAANSLTSFFAPSVDMVSNVLNSLFIRGASEEELNRQMVSLLSHHREMAKIRNSINEAAAKPIAVAEEIAQTEDQAKSVDKLVESLKKQVEQYSKIDERQKMFDDAIANKATRAQMDEIAALHVAIEAGKEHERQQKNLADATEASAQREIEWTRKRIDALNDDMEAREGWAAHLQIMDLEAADAERRRANESIRELAPTAIRGSAEAYRLIAARETRGADNPMTRLQKETNDILKRLERKFGVAVIAEF